MSAFITKTTAEKNQPTQCMKVNESFPNFFVAVVFMMIFLSELFSQRSFSHLQPTTTTMMMSGKKFQRVWLTDIFCRMRYVGDDETRRRIHERNGKLVIIINARVEIKSAENEGIWNLALIYIHDFPLKLEVVSRISDVSQRKNCFHPSFRIRFPL